MDVPLPNWISPLGGHIRRALIKSGVALLLAICVEWSGAAPPQSDRLTYLVWPTFQKGSLVVVNVELRFRGSTTGTTVIDLPREWGGKERLYEALSDFSVIGRSVALEAGARPPNRTQYTYRCRFLEKPGRTAVALRPIRHLFLSSAAMHGLDVTGLVERFVDQGNSILIAEDTFAACGKVTTVQRPRFDLGFDIRATDRNGGVVTGVDPTLSAYQAGLRDQMILTGRDGSAPGDATREVALHVLADGVERVIRYFPQSRDFVEVQSLDLRDFAGEADQDACARRLGGR
jgi:predicted metalloprotease with PDZ domain